MQTKQKRALSEAQAKRCEEATHPRCRCRCGGAAHGAKRLGEDPERAAFEQLPEDDPHHLPEKGKKQTVQPSDFFIGPHIAYDGYFVYRGYFGAQSRCYLRVYERRDVCPVFVATELVDNPGTSITNRAEHLAASAVSQFTPEWLGQPVIWIEHYTHGTEEHRGHPGDRGTTDTFDLVEFSTWHAHPEPDGGMAFGSPSWRALTLDEVRAWCGEVPT